MDNPTPEMSVTQAVKLSAVQCEQLLPSVTGTFNAIMAMIPIIGFGTFGGFFDYWNTYAPIGAGQYSNSGTSIPLFNDVWPNVYLQCVESWSDSVGSGSVTTTAQPYCDIGFITTGSSGLPNVQYGTTPSYSVSGGGTTLTMTYLDTNGNAGTYTATVSNPYAGSSNWAALTSAAHALLAHATMPTGGNIAMVQPISVSPGFAISTIGANIGAGTWGILACAYGLATRWPGGNLPYEGNYPIGGGVVGNSVGGGIAPTIADLPTYSSSITNNCGFVMCFMSVWNLTGNPPADSSDTNTNSHLNIYAQQMTVAPNPVMSGTVSQPSSLTCDSVGYSNPIVPIATVTFVDTDMALNSGYTYGLLGFRSMPA